MKKDSVWIEAHILQTVPPSCVNRDDTGNPKMGTFGGVQRGRVTSQAWKYSSRDYIGAKKLFDPSDYGYRTKEVQKVIAEEIKKLDATKDADELARKVVTEYLEFSCEDKNKGKKNNKVKTKTNIFISFKQVMAIAQLAADGCTDKDTYKKAFLDNLSWDIAAYGRMLTDKGYEGVEAATSYSHAVATHTVCNEYDGFTAMDDLANSQGAAYMGVQAFNSFTMYRYMNVNAARLAEHFDNAKVAEIVAKLVDSFINSMPEGKQHSFAHQCGIDAAYITIRDDNAYNFVLAFDTPVRMAPGGGYIEPSKKAFVEYAKKVYKEKFDEPIAAFASCSGMEELAPIEKPSVVVRELEKKVLEILNAREVD